MQTAECLAQPQIIVIPAIPTTQLRTVQRQLRVAAYCRVSTDQEEQLTSYEAQVAYYTDKIMTNPEWTMAGIFADEGITGTSAKKRPEFLRMIRLCKRGKIDREQLIDILKSNLEIILSEKSGNDINPILLESRIRELQKAMMELVAVSAKAGNPASYEEKFKEISEEIQSLQKTLERHKALQNGPDALTLQMQNICKALQDAPFECTKYKDSVVRQMIDTIKVMSKYTLRIIFKGGYVIEQSI